MRAELLHSLIALAVLLPISAPAHARAHPASSEAASAMIGASATSVIWAQALALQVKTLSIIPTAFLTEYCCHSKCAGRLFVGLCVQRPPPL